MGRRTFIAFVAICSVAVLYWLFVPLTEAQARKLAFAEMKFLCEREKWNCSPAKETQATDQGDLWLFIFAVPDVRYSSISIMISKHGRIDVGMERRGI